MITVSITEEHIRKGVCEDAGKCAFALAFKSMLNNKVASILVGELYTFVYLADEHNPKAKYAHTAELQQFIHEFDNHTNPDPIVLDLEWDVPEEWLKDEYKSNRKDSSEPTTIESISQLY